MTSNFLSSEGLSYFAELLKTNPVLEELDLRSQLHKNRANSLSLSCSENTKQLTALIDDTMRRRAELVSSVPPSISPSPSSSSPSRSNSFPVFHGFLSKKKVEKRLQAHGPGSFLFYLNKYIPNVLFIGIVQEAPSHHHPHPVLPPRLDSSPASSAATAIPKVVVHRRVQRVKQGYIFSGDAPHFQHELCEGDTSKQPPPKQLVPTLFEHCAWYISSHKEPLEYGDEWDEVSDRLRAVQMLMGLWGVKFFSPPHSKPPRSSPSPTPSSSSSSSSSINNNNNSNGNNSHYNNNHNNHHSHNHHNHHHHSHPHSPNNYSKNSPNANVYTTLTFLVHKNKSWLKYPVPVPPEG